jgi:hypothetical protein
MEKIQKREGLVCVCAECKKVIGTVGRVSTGTIPRITHGICPACADRLYGHIFRRTRAGKPAAVKPASPVPFRPPSSAEAD